MKNVLAFLAYLAFIFFYFIFLPIWSPATIILSAIRNRGSQSDRIKRWSKNHPEAAAHYLVISDGMSRAQATDLVNDFMTGRIKVR